MFTGPQGSRHNPRAAAAALAVQLRHLPAEVQRASADSCERKRGRQDVGGPRSRSE